MPKENKVYLGDGAYAAYLPQLEELVITTENGVETTNMVHLDRGSFEVLQRFAAQWFGAAGEVSPQQSITCPVCGRTSYNTNDVAHGWCGYCQTQTSPDAKQQARQNDVALEKMRKDDLLAGIVPQRGAVEFRCADDDGTCGCCGIPLTMETGWATASRRYCFKPECQQQFFEEARSMIRAVDPDLADRLARATKEPRG